MLINHSATVDRTLPHGALAATSIITRAIFLHVPQLPLNTLHAPRPQDQRVSPNTGALYLVKYCTCAHSKVDNAGRKPPVSRSQASFRPPVLSPVVWGLEESQVCRQSPQAIDKFLSSGAGEGGGGRVRTHSAAGFVIVCLSARRTCER